MRQLSQLIQVLLVDTPIPRIVITKFHFYCYLIFKNFPYGLVNTFEAHFCARANQQLEGVYFFEIYAPVLQWTTVYLILVLEVLLELKPNQDNFIAAFLYANTVPCVD